MPWTERTLMDERLIFIASCLRGDAPVGVLCARHGISRKTGHKWLARYRSEGAHGLRYLSCARHSQEAAITPAMAARLLALRAERPSWGPRKLLARLALDDAAAVSAGAAPAEILPAASTVCDLLRRHDLTRPRPRRPPPSGGKTALTPADAPNDSWAVDFK